MIIKPGEQLPYGCLSWGNRNCPRYWAMLTQDEVRDIANMPPAIRSDFVADKGYLFA